MRSILLLPAALLAASCSADMYCPGQSDFTWGSYDNIAWENNGSQYTVLGNGGVHGNAAFNLLGGFIEYEMDTSQSTAGTNTNFYTSSPDQSYFPSYCDIQVW